MEDRGGYFLEFIYHFPDDERIKVDFSPDNQGPYLEAGAKLWDKRFGHGTVIWLSEEPEVGYGSYCFRFTPPRGTIIVASYYTHEPHWLAWVPMRVIPPKYFKLLP
jgi:hypothetical protein